MRAAAALELLHACALIHDDVIDGSDTRRGAPAVHRKFAALHRTSGWRGDPERFGEAAAILLGDLALIWADAALERSGFDAATIQRAASVWDAMRVEVMCGQYLDVVEQARGGGSAERALRVARFKSAKYTIERPLHLGASLGGGGGELMAAFTSLPAASSALAASSYDRPVAVATMRRARSSSLEFLGCTLTMRLP